MKGCPAAARGYLSLSAQNNTPITNAKHDLFGISENAPQIHADHVQSREDVLVSHELESVGSQARIQVQQVVYYVLHLAAVLEGVNGFPEASSYAQHHFRRLIKTFVQ